jgi:hypothetical protein
MVGDRLLGEWAGARRRHRPSTRRKRGRLRRCVTRKRALRAVIAMATWSLTLLVLAPAASATASSGTSGQAGVSLPVWPVAIIGSLLIVAGALVLGAAAFVWPRRRR